MSSRLLRIPFWLATLGLGVVQAWTFRYHLSSDDIISYLDLSDAIRDGDWASVASGYWSPLYAAVLFLVGSVLDVSAAWEFQAVKLTNFLLLVVALLCFEVFLDHFLAYYRTRATIERDALLIPDTPLVVLGYGLFLVCTLAWTRVYCDTPDLLAAALFFSACSLVLRIHTRQVGWFTFASLGAVAGLLYLARAAMLPASFAFLAASVPRRGASATGPRVAAALLAFACIAGPHVAVLSLQKGRLSFGDAGKLNYVWLVNPGVESDISDHHWTGRTPEYGAPKHPPRMLFDSPQTYEFAEPVRGTYPLWADPSYWYDGMRVRFDATRQRRTSISNLHNVWGSMLVYIVTGYCVFAVAARARPRDLLRGMLRAWRLIVPAALAAAVYIVASDFEHNHMSFQPNTRYLAVSVVVLCFGLIAATSLADNARSRRLVAAGAAASLVAVSVILYDQITWDVWKGPRKLPRNVHWELATKIRALGVGEGGKIAMIGQESFHEFWARLARARIITQTPDLEGFWQADASRRAELLEALRDAGADAVVSYRCNSFDGEPWRSGWLRVGVEGRGYCVYLLDRSKTAAATKTIAEPSSTTSSTGVVLSGSQSTV